MGTNQGMFLLDENIPRKVLSVLRAAGYTVVRAYDVGLRAHSDAVVFAYACSYRMTIITFDTDYLNQTVFPPPHAGILVLRFFPRNTSFNALASAVLTAVTQLVDLPLSNRVYLLDPDGLREEQ